MSPINYSSILSLFRFIINMTLNIFSLTTLWSRSKQLENRIGEVKIAAIVINSFESISLKTLFLVRLNVLI